MTAAYQIELDVRPAGHIPHFPQLPALDDVADLELQGKFGGFVKFLVINRTAIRVKPDTTKAQDLIIDRITLHRAKVVTYQRGCGQRKQEQGDSMSREKRESALDVFEGDITACEVCSIPRLHIAG